VYGSTGGTSQTALGTNLTTGGAGAGGGGKKQSAFTAGGNITSCISY
jgi:hypothetical protein